MKSVKECINEFYNDLRDPFGFDEFGLTASHNLFSKSEREQIKSIKKFIQKNYEFIGKSKNHFSIGPEKDSDDKFVVNVYDNISISKKFDQTELTNIYFVFGKVEGDFDCSNCKDLKTLKGAPKEVEGDFNCSNCKGKFTKKDVLDVCIVKGSINV